jgi:hypothetical protein
MLKKIEITMNFKDQIKKTFQMIILVVAIYAFIFMTNGNYNIFYYFLSEYPVLFLNQDVSKIYKIENAHAYFILGIFCILTSTLMFFCRLILCLLRKMNIKIEINKDDDIKKICKALFFFTISLVFSFLAALYLTLYATQSLFNESAYNKAYIDGNTPLLSNGESRDYYIRTENGLFLKDNNYFDTVIGKKLHKSERSFLAMKEGTYLAYFNFMSDIDTASLSVEEKIWIYNSFIESYEVLYKKIIVMYKGEENSIVFYNKIWSERFKNLTFENYKETKNKCINQKEKRPLCFIFKEGSGKYKVTMKNLKDLKKTYWKNKDSSKHKSEKLGLLDVINIITAYK